MLIIVRHLHFLFVLLCKEYLSTQIPQLMTIVDNFFQVNTTQSAPIAVNTEENPQTKSLKTILQIMPTERNPFLNERIP